MPLLKRAAAAAGERSGAQTRIAMESAPTPAAGGKWPGAPAKSGILRTCSNPHCDSGWLHLWRSRETPVFEGGWCCSARCTVACVEAALGREADARGAAREVHRHRIPLGLAMLEQGWIAQNELRAALAAQRSAGCGKLGEWLVRQQSTSEERVTRTLGLQWGCPVLSIDFHHPGDLTALVPRLFVDAFGALPLRLAAGKILYLAFDDRVDPALALAVERMTGLRVEVGLVESSRFGPAHARALEARFPPAGLIEAATEQALAQALAKAIEESRCVEARLVRVHDCYWLRLWLRPQTGAVPEAGSIRDLIASTVGH
ncbi:MAG: hypothetical protein WBP85_17810 [Terracidiphilus sp.]